MSLVRWITVLSVVVMSLSLFNAPAHAQAPTATSGDCENAEQWLDETWERHLQATMAQQRSLIALQDGPPFDPELFQSTAEDLSAFVRVQLASNPPMAARAFNDIIMENRALYADAWELIAEYAVSGDEALAEKAAEKSGPARRLGERAFPAAEDFKVACGLTESEAFRLPACYGQEQTLWLNFTSLRMTIFTDTLEAANDRLELQLPIDDQLNEMEQLKEEQRDSRVPEGAEAYNAVIIEFFETAIRMYHYIASGNEVGANREYERFLDVADRFVELEAEYAAPCSSGGI